MTADDWSALAGVSSTALALAAVVVALVAFRAEHRRARFETARALHQDLTTGEVASARRLVGSLHYGDFGSIARTNDWASALTAYFTLLWCFERIEGGRTALLRGGVRSFPRFPRSADAVRYLDGLVAWHVAEYACGFAVTRRKIAEAAATEISDGESAAGFRRLLRALQDDGIIDRGYGAGDCRGSECPCSCHRRPTP
ncbi:hypothetical protein [Streptomyces sp. NPDC051014]|uniref:hypothetical protein n=1 Tax=Streptomyces sp. NPDC051014 TaxID=3155751 RepID=UPI0033C5239F